MNADDLPLLLGAYLDGEIDAFSARKLEERIRTEPAVAAAYEKLKALRSALRSTKDEDLPSEKLRKQIAMKLKARHIVPQHWPALAASFVAGAFLAGGMALGLLQFERNDIAEQIVADHIRALMAPQPADVFSSDRHTVKPWFAGKLASAPEVIDLATDGFPLAGGRVDVVGLQPAPTLVYRHGNHLISLTEVPDDGHLPLGFMKRKEKGYSVLVWRHDATAYWAVSDASPETLQIFAQLLQKALAGSEASQSVN